VSLRDDARPIGIVERVNGNGTATVSMAPQPVPPKANDFHCAACGAWVLSAPAPWARGRCMDRRCALYGRGQLMRAPRTLLPTAVSS
jgi:hypothetical protein